MSPPGRQTVYGKPLAFGKFWQFFVDYKWSWFCHLHNQYLRWPRFCKVEQSLNKRMLVLQLRISLSSWLHSLDHLIHLIKKKLNYSLGHTGSHHWWCQEDTCVRSRFTIGHEHKARVPKHPLNWACIHRFWYSRLREHVASCCCTDILRL